MKQIINPASVQFSAASKTLTFTGTIPATLGHILHITNVTRGVMYFQPQGGSDYTGTYAPPVLTLSCSTSGHADNDKLVIFYEDGLSPATESGNLASIQASLDELVVLQGRFLKSVDSLQVVDAAQRQRISVDGGVLTTLSTVSTVAAVTSLTNAVSIAGMDREMYINQARTAFHSNRTRIY